MEREINNYFEVFQGKEREYSNIPKFVKPAVEILITDGKFFAQKHLFDEDETIFMGKMVEPPDLGDTP